MPLDRNGHEVPDSTPVARPVRISTRPSTLDELKQLLRIVSREAEANGDETFEESEDFDVGDDAEPFSRWEIPTDEQLEGFAEQLRQEKAQRAAVAAGVSPPGVPGRSNGDPPPVGVQAVPPETPPGGTPTSP